MESFAPSCTRILRLKYLRRPSGAFSVLQVGPSAVNGCIRLLWNAVDASEEGWNCFNFIGTT